MKLSNKLLIGFVGLIFLYLSAAFTELRFKGDNENLHSKDAITETLPLENITFLNLDDVGTRISISTSDKPRIEIRSMVGGLLESLEYEIHNDTLEIGGLKADDKRRDVKLFLSKELSGISISNNSVVIHDINLTNLHFQAIESNITLSKNVRIEELTVIASEGSIFNASEVSIDMLSIDADHSNIFFYSTVQRIVGSVSNSSVLIIKGSGEINVKKDASSTINWYEDSDAVIRVENN